jgi:hypothetical protein
MRPLNRAHAGLEPGQPSGDPGSAAQDHRAVARQIDAGEDHEVDDAELVEMLQVVLSRKLREFNR